MWAMPLTVPARLALAPAVNTAARRFGERRNWSEPQIRAFQAAARAGLGMVVSLSISALLADPVAAGESVVWAVYEAWDPITGLFVSEIIVADP